MVIPQDSIHELQMKITNYKLTRATIAKSMQPYCDGLIRDAEAELLRRISHGDVEPTPPPASAAGPDAHPA